MTETKTLPEQDRVHIQEVRHSFARALDARDWALLDSLFLDEVDADLSAFGVPPGRKSRAELVGIFRHAFRRPASENPTQQLYSNFSIDVAGDQATCRSYLVGHHVLPGTPGGDEVTLRAEYVDRLRRTQDGWKLAGLTLRVLSMSGNPAVFA